MATRRKRTVDAVGALPRLDPTPRRPTAALTRKASDLLSPGHDGVELGVLRKKKTRATVTCQHSMRIHDLRKTPAKRGLSTSTWCTPSLPVESDKNTAESEAVQADVVVLRSGRVSKLKNTSENDLVSPMSRKVLLAASMAHQQGNDAALKVLKQRNENPFV